MRERDSIPDNEDRYWTDDLALGEAPLQGEISTARRGQGYAPLSPG
jgi:hypothetical protein